jgi:hypothetical protein
MEQICFFDLLLVELIHNLFNNFSEYEIIFSFSNVSDYANDILKSYSTFRLGF